MDIIYAHVYFICVHILYFLSIYIFVYMYVCINVCVLYTHACKCILMLYYELYKGAEQSANDEARMILINALAHCFCTIHQLQPLPCNSHI